jgi:hypothetical protein
VISAKKKEVIERWNVNLLPKRRLTLKKRRTRLLQKLRGVDLVEMPLAPDGPAINVMLRSFDAYELPTRRELTAIDAFGSR